MCASQKERLLRRGDIMVSALHLPPRIAGAVRGPGARLNLRLHEPFGGERQHRPHQITIGALLHQLDQRHSVVGHRRLRPRVQARNSNLSSPLTKSTCRDSLFT
jgi:hypothetical protein